MMPANDGDGDRDERQAATLGIAAILISKPRPRDQTLESRAARDGVAGRPLQAGFGRHSARFESNPIQLNQWIRI